MLAVVLLGVWPYQPCVVCPLASACALLFVNHNISNYLHVSLRRCNGTVMLIQFGGGLSLMNSSRLLVRFLLNSLNCIVCVFVGLVWSRFQFSWRLGGAACLEQATVFDGGSMLSSPASSPVEYLKFVNLFVDQHLVFSGNTTIFVGGSMPSAIVRLWGHLGYYTGQPIMCMMSGMFLAHWMALEV